MNTLFLIIIASGTIGYQSISVDSLTHCEQEFELRKKNEVSMIGYCLQGNLGEVMTDIIKEDAINTATELSKYSTPMKYKPEDK